MENPSVVVLSSTSSQVSRSNSSLSAPQEQCNGCSFWHHSWQHQGEVGEAKKAREQGGIQWHAWHQLAQPSVSPTGSVQLCLMAYKGKTVETLSFSTLCYRAFLKGMSCPKNFNVLVLRQAGKQKDKL